MRVRVTVQLQPDGNGFAPLPGSIIDIDPATPGMQRLLNVGYLVPVEPVTPPAAQTAGVASPDAAPSETLTGVDTAEAPTPPRGKAKAQKATGAPSA